MLAPPYCQLLSAATPAGGRAMDLNVCGKPSPREQAGCAAAPRTDILGTPWATQLHV
jgi:hypothetical protein